MSITKAARSITLTVILATYISSTIANAEPDQQSGKRRGPPPEAIEVCADQAKGAACSFSGRRGDVTGSCIVPPQDQDELVCTPEGGPPKDHGEK
jgi:hypothetical protein